MKLKDRKAKPPKILLYGEPGSGKTALALTLGEGAFLMDFDDGLQTGLSLDDDHRSNRVEIDYEPFYEDDPKKGIAYRQGKIALMKIVNEVNSGKWKHRALIIDSLTTMVDGCVRFILGNTNRIGSTLQLQEWGIMIAEVEQLMVLLRSLPIVIVLIAHQHHYEMDGKSKTEIAIPCKKLPGKISSYFDEVWQMDKKSLSGGKVDYIVRTKGSGSVMARSRGSLEDGLSANLGLPELLKRIGYDWSANDAGTVKTKR